MLLPIKPICERKDMRRDGTSVIYIQYCYSAEKRTLLNTQIAIPPEYWNKRRLCISNDLPEIFGNARHLNSELNRMLRLTEDIIYFAIETKIEDRAKFVKETFKPHFNFDNLQGKAAITIVSQVSLKKQNKDIYFQIDDYIKSKEKKVSPATICVYNCMKTQLLAYQVYRKKKITFESLDFEFYDGFINFLTFDYVQKRRKTVIKGLKINSIGKTIKQLRIFIRDRIKRKIMTPIDLSDFNIPEEEADAIYLTFEEIKKIYETDLTDFKYLEQYRNFFVLACLTGLRFSDFSTLRFEYPYSKRWRHIFV